VFVVYVSLFSVIVCGIVNGTVSISHELFSHLSHFLVVNVGKCVDPYCVCSWLDSRRSRRPSHVMWVSITTAWRILSLRMEETAFRCGG